MHLTSAHKQLGLGGRISTNSQVNPEVIEAFWQQLLASAAQSPAAEWNSWWTIQIESKLRYTMAQQWAFLGPLLDWQ